MIDQASDMTPFPCSNNVTCGYHGTAEEVWHTLMAVYLGVILLIALAFNGTVCLVFFKKPHLLTVSNCFVLNLSCCQLALSILVLPFSLAGVVSRDWIFAEVWCDIQGYLFTVMMVAIQFSLLIVSVDRHFAIINSLRYPYVFTQTLCNILIGATWLCGFIIGLPPFIGFGKYKFQRHQYMCTLDWSSNFEYLVVFSVCCFFVPVLIQTWCYMKIFRAALGHTKRNKVYPSVSQSGRCSVPDIPSDSSDESGETNNSSSRHTECKAVRTIFLITVAYCICWVPYLTSSFLTLVQAITIPDLNATGVCLVFSTSVLNPVIYAYMNRVTRREIGRFLCGSPAATVNEDFLSTSISAFSTAKPPASVWTSHQRFRTRSTGGAEMDTIHEESEIDISDTKSENDAAFLPTDEPRCSDHQVCQREVMLSPKSLPSSSVKKEVTTASCSRVTRSKRTPISKATVYDLRDTAWNIVRSEKFLEERRRMKRSNSESYSFSEKRKHRKDYGSFLYFEHGVTKQQRNKSSSGKGRGSKEVTVDHVQHISISNNKNQFEFCISVTDVDRNKETIKVDSNMEIEKLEMKNITLSNHGTSHPNGTNNNIINEDSNSTDTIFDETQFSVHRKSGRIQSPPILVHRWSNEERVPIEDLNATQTERNCFSA